LIGFASCGLFPGILSMFTVFAALIYKPFGVCWCPSGVLDPIESMCLPD
jgi:hypothetical protein